MCCTFSSLQTISMASCTENSWNPPSVEYTLEYKGNPSQKNASGVQATFSLAQKRKDRKKMVDTYLTTYNIPLPDYAPVSTL